MNSGTPRPCLKQDKKRWEKSINRNSSWFNCRIYCSLSTRKKRTQSG